MFHPIQCHSVLLVHVRRMKTFPASCEILHAPNAALPTGERGQVMENSAGHLANPAGPMADISKTGARMLRLLLLAIVIGLSRAVAANSNYEEEFLAVPPANVDASAKDFDYFFRFIRWSKLDDSIALRIYFSRHTETQPDRGLVLLKIKSVDGQFHEGSRPLTEEEVKRIGELLDHEEIFSLPERQRFRASDEPFDPGSGPGYDSFVLIDKAQHTEAKTARDPELSRPAAGLVRGLKASLGDFFSVVELGEKAAAQTKAAQQRWDAEVPAAHAVAIAALNDATAVEVEGRVYGGVGKDSTPIIRDAHFTIHQQEVIRKIHDILARTKFKALPLHPGVNIAFATDVYLRVTITMQGGGKLTFHVIANQLQISGLRDSESSDPDFSDPLHQLLFDLEHK